MNSAELTNCLVRFLIGISAYSINLNIVLDGIKPYVMSENWEMDCEDAKDPHINSLYTYKNPGIEEIVHAVNLMRDANLKHTYYFAPYEATAQVYYLHDNYCGGSMCAYPDILMYAWYNFIIDIDLDLGEFTWVKYSKDSRLNEHKNLAKAFLNMGLYTLKKQEVSRLTINQIRDEVTECNSDVYYDLKQMKQITGQILQVLESPWIMSVKIEIDLLRRTKMNNDVMPKYDYFGKTLDKFTYFAMYMGNLSPKICEKVATEKNLKVNTLLNLPLEHKYLRFNTQLNNRASGIIEEMVEGNKNVENAHNMSNGASTDVGSVILAKLMSSEVFDEKIMSSSPEFINTITLWAQCLDGYFNPVDNDFEQINPENEILKQLTDSQVWPYLFLNLWKEIRMFSDKGMTDFGKFYSGISDWRHDQQIFVILVMIQQGLILDFNQLHNSGVSSLEDNAINLVWGVVSLMDIQIGEPWQEVQFNEDPKIKSFFYLGDLIRESTNNFLEAIIYKTIFKQKLAHLKDYTKLIRNLKFQRSQGLYFATILKQVLEFKSGDASGAQEFKKINWPWVKHTSVDHFIEALKSALTLFQSIHKIVADLAEQSGVEYMKTAFDNADFVFKSKIKELSIDSLL